ncbi:Kelch repeat-containing protein [Brevundimonas lenta]|uniref:Galactose oxidase n=1 Tax=Brevundimonas lenta TaxID=424796 RepID=A0A7W6NQ72_9CAUL|nr:kelch repeat-containing protein [Brevundimonas lenta]MBB4083284.1 hypothetical protein [Brevundimonas lenta]
MYPIDRRVFLAAAGASAAVPFAACAQEPAPAWSARESMPWPVQEIYATVSKGRIVIAGGLVGRPDGLHIEDRTAFYSPAADQWDLGPSLPEPRHHPMLIANGDGRVYALGGYGRTDAGDWTSMTDVWTLGTNGWEEAPSLPGPQSEAVGVAFEGALHLITGRAPRGSANGEWSDQRDIATHRVFLGGSWETARPNPMARNSAAGAVLNGVIWVAGGRTVEGSGTGRLDRYDPKRDRWDTLAPIPRSRASDNQVGGGLAMAAVGDRLVAFGGEWFAGRGDGGVFRETWIYDPAADAWSAGPAMLTPRHGLAAAAIGDTVYAVAGGAVASGGEATGIVEALTL